MATLTAMKEQLAALEARVAKLEKAQAAPAPAPKAAPAKSAPAGKAKGG